jgi:hypothetical protein
LDFVEIQLAAFGDIGSRLLLDYEILRFNGSAELWS